MLDTSRTHSKNGLLQCKAQFSSGFSICISVSTGTHGESTCLIIHDSNCYADEDSRSNRPREYIIPIDCADDLKEIKKLIDDVLIERKRTLVS